MQTTGYVIIIKHKSTQWLQSSHFCLSASQPRKKVTFPFYSTNFCWPFHGDVSNPVKFLQIPLKIQSVPVLSKNKHSPDGVCAQHSFSPVQKNRGDLYISLWKLLPGWDDDTSWHVTMTLARIQSSRRDLKAQQDREKPSWEFTWSISVAFNVMISHMSECDSAEQQMFCIFISALRLQMWAANLIRNLKYAYDE